MSKKPTDRFDTRYTDKPVCPHCGHEQKDDWEFPDEGEVYCGECEKEFHLYRMVTWSYVTSKNED